MRARARTSLRERLERSRDPPESPRRAVQAARSPVPVLRPGCGRETRPARPRHATTHRHVRHAPHRRRGRQTGHRRSQVDPDPRHETRARRHRRLSPGIPATHTSPHARGRDSLRLAEPQPLSGHQTASPPRRAARDPATHRLRFTRADPADRATPRNVRARPKGVPDSTYPRRNPMLHDGLGTPARRHAAAARRRSAHPRAAGTRAARRPRRLRRSLRGLPSGHPVRLRPHA